MAPTQFVTQCVTNWERFEKQPHISQIALIKPLSKFRSKFLRKFLQNLFSVFGSLPFQFILLFLSYANIMNDLQSIMKMTLIQHYESHIIRQPQGVALTVKIPQRWIFPKIMNYELRIDPDTHVRASLQEDRFTRYVDYPK